MRALGRGAVQLATAAAVLLAIAVAAPAHAQDFAQWMRGLRADATAAGIRQGTLDAALAGVAPIPRVVELDRKQPETTLTFQEYIDRVVPQQRVDRARERLAQARPLIERISQQYGVQPRYLVALWGIESDFGRQMGNFSVVAALATLAYEGRRATFFRAELLDALRILDQGHTTPAAMKGSWAGAMGQSQFMPSSFLRFAVDYDGDGRRDIWTTEADVLASIANYLARSGWRGSETWGREVRLPAGLAAGLIGLDVRKDLAEWQALGVRRSDGEALPRADVKASLLQPGGAEGPTYLVYENFRTILKWNRSNYFATAVGLLSDRIEGAAVP
jgi:membrane-bound lytic murein transglycosylase B